MLSWACFCRRWKNSPVSAGTASDRFGKTYGAPAVSAGGLWICGQPEIWQIGAVCAGLALLVFWLGREKIEKGRRLAAAGSLLLLWILLFARAAPEFSITALDVGQGDCLVLQTGEACFLVDGGSSSENRVGQYRILPYLKQQGISRIEGIFITHPDQDHINGILELLKAVGERQVSFP